MNRARSDRQTTAAAGLILAAFLAALIVAIGAAIWWVLF